MAQLKLTKSKTLKPKLTKKSIREALKEFEIEPTNVFYSNLYNISTVEYLITRAAEEISTCTVDNLEQALEKSIQILILAKIKRLAEREVNV